MSGSRWLASGALASLSADARRALLDRSMLDDADLQRRVAEIVARVRREGDGALLALAKEYDGVELSTLEIPRFTWDGARARVDGLVRAALERAAENIAAVHRASLPNAIETTTRDGVIIARRADPLDRVGVYAPGGRAAYPSSVLMGVVPARIAGVREIVVCSPPTKAGVPSDIVLAAAAIAGAHRVFAVGGAGAIAAMAYGTSTMPRVDRIVGPGNAFVAEAKLQVMRDVPIDAPAGPSELLVVADGTADPKSVAREILAQAEHDPRAAVVVVCVDAQWAADCDREISARLALEPRADVITEALASRGGLVIARDLADAMEFAAEYAPEHLLLAVTEPDRWRARVRNAGSVFDGGSSSVAFGDYMTGANHVLPTGGYARSFSGLSTLDFVRWTTFQRIDRAAAARLSADTACLANAEGLPAHASAALYWSSE